MLKEFKDSHNLLEDTLSAIISVIVLTGFIFSLVYSNSKQEIYSSSSIIGIIISLASLIINSALLQFTNIEKRKKSLLIIKHFILSTALFVLFILTYQSYFYLYNNINNHSHWVTLLSGIIAAASLWFASFNISLGTVKLIRFTSSE